MCTAAVGKRENGFVQYTECTDDMERISEQMRINIETRRQQHEGLQNG